MKCRRRSEAAEKALEEAKNANVDPDEIERLESRARVAIARAACKEPPQEVIN